MARRHKHTEEDGIFKTHFADQIKDMQVLMQEALEQAQARAKAVQDKIKADKERIANIPRWKRTKEEKKHVERIEQAKENLQNTEEE